MTVKKTLGAYADCAQVMDIALQRGLIRIPFPTRGQAINFRQRCYRLRKQLLEADVPPPGALPSSRYDTIIITIAERGDPGDDTLIIRSRDRDAQAAVSRILDEHGNPIELTPDDLEASAANLRKELGLE